MYHGSVFADSHGIVARGAVVVPVGAPGSGAVVGSYGDVMQCRQRRGLGGGRTGGAEAPHEVVAVKLNIFRKGDGGAAAPHDVVTVKFGFFRKGDDGAKDTKTAASRQSFGHGGFRRRCPLGREGNSRLNANDAAKKIRAAPLSSASRPGFGGMKWY